MTKAKALCLNMIVKNEVANLERCLTSVAEHIACWIIGDTGSSDGTQNFVRSFFAARNIPGELHSFPFHNFEQARNAALDHAYASSLTYDYILFDDADMELVVEDRNFHERLEAPGYLLLQRAGSGLTYWNTRLVRRDAGARYHGVTHEYVDVPGGVKELPGIWYKDHASGSNRVDKFERDIRLLSEALEKEPNNHRYWFYLAQSYRDAGQTEKAAEIYAKRAGMGGWDEEAWHARLEEARCLRGLGNESGFLREALAAFNQRPQRAEPLYDLARFYREKGMNDASLLFSEPGLTLQRPEQDILFLEDFAYSAGLKEEYSIAAYYSRDPARRDGGFAACNWLALARSVPIQSRDLARSNLFFYLKSASAIMPSFTARPVGFSPPDGFHPSNSSVTRVDNEIVLLQRAVNFALSEDGSHRVSSDGTVHARNFLLRLDADLATQSSSEILPPADMSQPAFPQIQGFDNARLFAWRDGIWCVACVRELTPEGWCDQVLTRIEDISPGFSRFTDWCALRQQGPRRHEENWMPRVVDGGLQFICLCDPTCLVDEYGHTLSETTPVIAAEQFRGGTQAIVLDGGSLALVHEVSERDKRQYYQHRFVWFETMGRLKRVSRPFFFIRKGVEFAAGLAWHPDGKRLLISFGVGDNTAWVATVDADEVRRMLAETERLPWESPEASTIEQGRRGPDNERTHPIPANLAAVKAKDAGSVALLVQPVTPPTSRILPTNFESWIDPFWIPKTIPEKSVLGTDSKESAWVPDAPAAGTELMLAGLKARIGGELGRINLQVNHPGCKDDTRPRVVWMHHDVNQQWVQWCKEKELVDIVDCFVFVSYWQREQYLNAFGLPPQRCVVLRHALDLSAGMRRWEPEPIYRCAYTSTPFRGLSVLLDAWERLNPANAELHIWSSMKLYLADDGTYEHLYERARAMPQVIYHGIAPNAELRAALRKMHFLVYPCTFRETACLSVIEAMAAGCRVIVPSLGALPETTGGFARVYPPNADNNEHAADFAEVLADEIARPWAGQPELSLEQQRHCAAVFDWHGRIEEWRRLIDSIVDRAGRRGPLRRAVSPSLAAFVTGNGRGDTVAAARALTKGGSFVEVGTFKADFAERLCIDCEPAKLYCVDPYRSYADYADTINGRDNLDSIYEEARARMARFGDRVEFIKAFSVDAAEQFPDDSIDFVYIDANHSFRFVYEDLTCWYPKVKSGGLICGDDAIDTDERERNAEGDVEIAWMRDANGTVTSGGHYGVLKAVKAFCSEHSIEFFLSGSQYLIQRKGG